MNHLLVPAKTGDVAEYASLGPDATVSPQVTGAIATFLSKGHGVSSRQSSALLIRVTGHDRPGVTFALTSILARYEVRVLDIGQAVIHDGLAFGILIELPGSIAVVGVAHRSAARGAPPRRRGQVLGVIRRRVRRVGLVADAANDSSSRCSDPQSPPVTSRRFRGSCREAASTSIASIACRHASRSSHRIRWNAFASSSPRRRRLPRSVDEGQRPYRAGAHDRRRATSTWRSSTTRFSGATAGWWRSTWTRR